jgi:mitotic spindle assembly checkpoint protein MAD2B
VVVNHDGEREERKRGEDLGGTQTTPIRAVDAGEMVFEMWIEEGRAKAEISNTNNSSMGSG